MNDHEIVCFVALNVSLTYKRTKDTINASVASLSNPEMFHGVSGVKSHTHTMKPPTSHVGVGHQKNMLFLSHPLKTLPTTNSWPLKTKKTGPKKES